MKPLHFLPPLFFLTISLQGAEQSILPFSAEELKAARTRLDKRQATIELLYALFTGKPHEAQLKKLEQIDPDADAAAYARGFAQYRKKEKSAALLALEETIRRNPHFDLAHNLIGLIYTEAEEYGRASDAFQRAYAAAPFEPSYSYNLAQSLYKLGRYDEALAIIERALNAKYNSHDFFYLAALIQRDRRNYPAALAAFENSRQFGQASPAFLKAYLQTAYLAGDTRLSLKLSQELATSADPDIQRLIGRIRLQHGEFARAMPHLRLVAYQKNASLEDKKAYLFCLHKQNIATAQALRKLSGLPAERKELEDYLRSLRGPASPGFRDPLLLPPR